MPRSNKRVSKRHELVTTEEIKELFSDSALPTRLRQDLFKLTSHQRVVINRLRSLIPEAKNSDARNVLQDITDKLIHRNDEIETLVSGTLDNHIRKYRFIRLKK